MHSGHFSKIDEAASEGDETSAHRMTAERRSAGNAVVVFSGHAAGTGLGFLATILMMRELGPDQFGVVAVSTVVMTVLWLLTGRGLDQAMLRKVSRVDGSDGENAGVIRTSAFRMKLVYGGALALAGMCLSGVLTRLFLGPDVSAGTMMMACIASLAASIWGFRTASVQAEERFRSYALLYAGNNAVRVLAILVLIAAGILTPAWAMATAIVGFGIAAVGGRYLAPKASGLAQRRPDVERSLFRYSRWLIVSSVIHQLYYSVDLLLVGGLKGTEAAGIYGSSLRFVQLVDLLSVSVLTVMLPRVCRAKDGRDLRRQAGVTLKTSAAFAVVALPGYWLMGPVIGWVAPEFEPSVELFQIIFIGAIFAMLTHPLQAILHSVGKTAWLTAMDVGLLATALTGHYLAIRTYGVYGAAYMAMGLRILAGVVLLVIVLRIIGRAVPLNEDS